MHNRRSGLDVDKLDYLARDAMSVLGASRPLPIDRLLGAARVAVRAEQHVLAFDEGVAGDVAETFALRARLHRQIYQQRAVLVAENLLVDLMAARDADAAPRLLDAARDADAAPRLLDAARDADAAPRLLDAARDADAFLALTDAAVLAPPPPGAGDGWRAAWQALHRRPWLARVPATAVLPTLPACRACGRATAVADVFCPACGETTANRTGALQEGLLVPPACGLTEGEATRAVATFGGAGAATAHARVYLADVHCGAVGEETDPHGRAWRVYGPLRGVVFCGRDGRVIRVSDASVHAPRVPHVRTAWCYLPAHASPEELRAAEDAFAAWARAVGGELAEDEDA